MNLSIAFYQKRLYIASHLSIGKSFVNAVDRIFPAELSNGRMESRVLFQEFQIFFNVARRVLGGTNNVKSLECNHLRLNGYSAAVAVLPRNEINAAVPENIHPLRNRIRRSGCPIRSISSHVFSGLFFFVNFGVSSMYATAFV